MGIVAGVKEYKRDMLSPNPIVSGGGWFHMRTKDYVSVGAGSSVTVTGVSEFAGNTALLHKTTRHVPMFGIPVFVAGGAIVPKAYVDDNTADITGSVRRNGDVAHTELIVEVYREEQQSQTIEVPYTVYDDDGISTNYSDVSGGSGLYADNVAYLRLTNVSHVRTSATASAGGYQTSGNRTYVTIPASGGGICGHRVKFECVK